MDIKERKTVDMLTKDSVSILTKKFIKIDEIDTQVGENHRVAYVNSKSGRETLILEQPDEVVNSVLAIWGNEPTIPDVELPE